ncbi:MAG: PspC domain-containing protein [Prevotella sp.]|jgi:phage shock protein PspC (stress-responsive transcriptional regulator)|nr:PspC domain-containing protein [Prevotella sp.]
MEEMKKLYRTRPFMLGGVCSGVARYFDLDPTVIRLAYVLLTLFTCFSGILAYIILWIVIPEEPFKR